MQSELAPRTAATTRTHRAFHGSSGGGITPWTTHRAHGRVGNASVQRLTQAGTASGIAVRALDRTTLNSRHGHLLRTKRCSRCP
ncbi:hypothetical protein ABZX92_33800 [Lentzea sp. NPDC006480]|uniref:hypothetical protein n=1 Tax=Lentzea sp. NPDC006480 TaxID=3157176 RepID=UPI0033B9169E